MIGAVQAPITSPAKDEVVNNCIVDYNAEQLEVASYAALIAATPERTPVPRTLVRGWNSLVARSIWKDGFCS